MTTKIQKVKDSLSDGPLSFAEICNKTGLDSNIVGVYLSTLHKRGEVIKTGTRGSFAYSTGAGGGSTETRANPAEPNGVGSESGELSGLGGNTSAEATWPGNSKAAEVSADGAG